MANDVSNAVKNAIYSGASERVFIALVEISHPETSKVVRFTSDGKDTTSSGKTYPPRPFKVRIPDDLEGKQPSAQLQISNLDTDLIDFIRTVVSPPTVELKIVLDSTPSTTERGPWKMQLTDVTYDRSELSGTLRAPSLLSEPFPGHTYNVQDYVGL